MAEKQDAKGEDNGENGASSAEGSSNIPRLIKFA